MKKINKEDFWVKIPRLAYPLSFKVRGRNEISYNCKEAFIGQKTAYRSKNIAIIIKSNKLNLIKKRLLKSKIKNPMEGFYFQNLDGKLEGFSILYFNGKSPWTKNYILTDILVIIIKQGLVKDYKRILNRKALLKFLIENVHIVQDYIKNNKINIYPGHLLRAINTERCNLAKHILKKFEEKSLTQVKKSV